ncbi:MAG: APC family permease [Candidatus Bathyarchaeota archaeon]|nr:APC family permease [Candidatus Bathyarchaeota archaeon]
MENTEQPPTRLKRALGLWDAVNINVGAIIGGGIFVVTGIVAGYAGSALMISMAFAAVVALFTALSFVELTTWQPVEGAVYEYTRRLVSPFLGFLSGWMWVIANTFGGAAVSLGFGYYLGAVFEGLPANVVAALLCLGFTALNFVGLRQSALINNVLVAVKLAVLGFFVGFGALFVKAENFVPFEPFSGGMLLGMCFIFFAFGGVPRVAVMAEEVKDAKRNVPRAVLLSLLICAIIYVLVGTVAVGLVGPAALADSNAPLTVAMGGSGSFVAVEVLAVGGAIATASVLLAAVLGVSRMAFSMARNRDMPKLLCRIHRQFGTPYVAIWIVGLVMSLVVLFADLTSVVAVTTFGLLFTYICANISALRLKKESRLYPKAVSVVGLITSALLLVFIFYATPPSGLIGTGFLAVGVVIHYVRGKRRQKKNLHAQKMPPVE